MTGNVFVHPHALKHGLNENQILFSWKNFIRKRYRQPPYEEQVVAIGCDKDGTLIQMVAIEKTFGTLVYHAMTPPTEKVLAELGLTRR